MEVLGQKLQHPTDYELALNYFLEEFAGDTGFMQRSELEDGSPLRAVLAQAAAQALGKPQARLEQFKAFRLPNHGFNHGNAAAEGHVLLFFYFEKVDHGIDGVISRPARCGGGGTFPSDWRPEESQE